MATKKPRSTTTIEEAQKPPAAPVQYLRNPRVPAPVQVNNPDHERHGQAGHITAIDKTDADPAAWSCSVCFDLDDTTEAVAVTDLQEIR